MFPLPETLSEPCAELGFSVSTRSYVTAPLLDVYVADLHDHLFVGPLPWHLPYRPSTSPDLSHAMPDMPSMAVP